MIPVSEWRAEMERDPRIISTAIAEVRRQGQSSQDEQPGAGGPFDDAQLSG
jgi:hypothetical protein